MWPGRASDHSPPSSAVVMEEYSYTSTHPLGHTGPVTGSLYLVPFLFMHVLSWRRERNSRPKHWCSPTRLSGNSENPNKKSRR